jgi:hypothetical protein
MTKVFMVLANPPRKVSVSERAIEQMIQAKGLTAPRITPEDVDANIQCTEVVEHTTPSGQVLRWAVLTTQCGYAVSGKPSCSVSSENDNAELGCAIAIKNARDEMWALMGYALKQKLSNL